MYPDQIAEKTPNRIAYRIGSRKERPRFSMFGGSTLRPRGG